MPEDELSQALERLADLGHVSGGVGHHVINAFSAIVSNAEILRLTANTPRAVDPVVVSDLIVKTSLDASAVARRLIDFTRSATEVGSGHVALDSLVTEVLPTEQAAAKPGVTWVAELAPVPQIVGNPAQLRTMLRYLIANALEALPEQGGTLTLATSVDARGWVCLEVCNSGTDLEPSTLERAIEPFFTTRPGHFGVGLSIANGIWRRHHGTLGLISRPGEGTTIRLCVEPAGSSTRAGLRR